MITEGASQRFLDRLEMVLTPPLQTRADRLREEWDDDEAFASFAAADGGDGFAS